MELKRLKKRHYDAIEMLLKGKSSAEVVKKSKVTVDAVYMWCALPAFMEQKELHRQELLKKSMARLSCNADTAAKKVTEVMNCGSAHVGIKAAIEVLNRLYGTPTHHQEIEADVKTESKKDLSILIRDKETKKLLKDLHKKLNK